jgi:hypothetical protein
MTNPAVPTPAPTPNTWSSIAMAGYIAASLDYVDDTLISALQSVAKSSGPQAALMSNTVISTGDGVAAGGPMPVGTRSTPASALVYGSQGGQAAQFAANSPWFFPTVSAWVAVNPVPPEEQSAPADGSLPMQAPA